MTTNHAVRASVRRRREQEEKMRSQGWLSTTEIAKKIGVTKGTVHAWIGQYKLRHVKAGRAANSPIYVDARAMAEHIGSDAAKALGLVPG